jgi:oligopeptide/dipeptide ABC transporter ATP-binding protein
VLLEDQWLTISTQPTILEVKELRKHFPLQGDTLAHSRARVLAVDGVTFSVQEGETLGIVGESGCGKTTVGRCIVALEKPTSGQILFRGREIFTLNRKEMKSLRSKVQIVFQDPFASLNPRWSIRDAISEPLVVSGKFDREVVDDAVRRLIRKVGLNEDHLHRFPHEFSGGQRQRICIARALSVEPDLIILDEPTASLDVSVQAQILNLLKDLQQEPRLTFVFISHNLSVIKHMSTRIAVMYLGKIVEIAESDELFANPMHPYTRALLESIPIPNPSSTRMHKRLEGEVPSPINPPSACRFRTRCPIAIEKCSKIEPVLEEYAPNHWAACHLAAKS